MTDAGTASAPLTPPPGDLPPGPAVDPTAALARMAGLVLSRETVDTALELVSLCLRYVALGGTGDALDLDGYLQGLIPLEVFQQDVLAQSLNEALDERYRETRVPLSSPAPGESDDHLRSVVEQLLQVHPPRLSPEAGPAR
jgi:hypothetical protein